MVRSLFEAWAERLFERGIRAGVKAGKKFLTQELLVPQYPFIPGSVGDPEPAPPEPQQGPPPVPTTARYRRKAPARPPPPPPDPVPTRGHRAGPRPVYATAPVVSYEPLDETAPPCGAEGGKGPCVLPKGHATNLLHCTAERVQFKRALR